MNMKLKLFLTCLFLLLILPTATRNHAKDFDKTVRVSVLSNLCYDNMVAQNFGYQISDILKKKDQKFECKKYFLNCHSDCGERNLEEKFERVWEKIKSEKTDFLIIYNNIIWRHFKHEILEYAKENKVGLFNIYYDDELNRDLIELGDKMSNIFISAYKIQPKEFINFFKANSRDFKDFYIFRDSCFENLKIADDLKEELRNISYDYNIYVKHVRTEHQLKTEILKLQTTEAQGVIIPLMLSLTDNKGGYITINNILDIISSLNKKHIELSVNHDASEFMGLSYARNLHVRHATLNSNLERFLIQRITNKVEFNETKFIINQSKLYDIFRGRELLNITSDYVDIYE